MRSVAIVTLALALPFSCAAQRGASGGGFHGGAPPGHAPTHRFPSAGSLVARGAYASRFNRYSPYGSLLLPFFDDAFALDDLYASGYPVASQPPMIPLETALALAGSRLGMGEFGREPSPAEPLMIELKDGQYVRVSGEGGGELQTLPAESQPGKSAHVSPAGSSAPARELPSAVLVFRDGHREEVRDYTIADGFLYAQSDFYANGYWNKKIDLTSLDLAQTTQVNADRNVNFVIPSSPNEVIARF